MPRAQHKRMQYRLYHHLLESGPMTSRQLLEWYNHDRPQLSRSNSKGAQHGSTIRGVSSVLRSSILFEVVSVSTHHISYSEAHQDRAHRKRVVSVWGARPLDMVVERAIASKRQLKKFPHFLQKAITEKLQEESE